MRQGIAPPALSGLRHFLVGLLQQSRNILLLFTQDMLPWLRRRAIARDVVLEPIGRPLGLPRPCHLPSWVAALHREFADLRHKRVTGGGGRRNLVREFRFAHHFYQVLYPWLICRSGGQVAWPVFEQADLWPLLWISTGFRLPLDWIGSLGPNWSAGCLCLADRQNRQI